MKDLAEITLELMINSLEAQASSLSVTLDIHSSPCFLEIKDDGIGLSPERLERIFSPYETSRQTRSLGFGLPFFKQAIEQAEGTVHISSLRHQGTTLQATWNAKHLDALPLGNFGEACALVLQREPTLKFTLSTGHHPPFFNSEELSEIMKPLSLDEPEIQRWIEASINEQLTSKELKL